MTKTLKINGMEIETIKANPMIGEWKDKASFLITDKKYFNVTVKFKNNHNLKVGEHLTDYYESWTIVDEVIDDKTVILYMLKDYYDQLKGQK